MNIDEYPGHSWDTAIYPAPAYRAMFIVLYSERIKRLIEDQAFLRSYDLAPRPPPSPARKLDRRHTEDRERETIC
jgi:hypothetical protein